MRRVSIIEATLTDWFRREGWSISEGNAIQFIYGDEDDSIDEVTVNLSRLADELDREFDRIGAAK